MNCLKVDSALRFWVDWFSYNIGGILKYTKNLLHSSRILLIVYVSVVDDNHSVAKAKAC